MATVADSVLASLGLDQKDLEAGIKVAQDALSRGLNQISASFSASLATISKGMTSTRNVVKARLEDLRTIFDQISEKIARDLEKTFTRAGLKEKLEKSIPDVKSIAGKALNGLKGLFAPFTEGLSIEGIAENFYQTAQAVSRLSKEFGIGVEELQQWQGVAQKAGVSGEEFEDAFAIVAARAQACGHTTEEELGGLVDTFANVSDEAAAALGEKMQLPDNFVSMLRLGRDELTEMLLTQRDLGLISAESVAVSDELGGAMSNLKTALTAAAGVIVSALGPSIQWGTEKLTALVNFLREHETFTKVFFSALALVITAMLIPAFTSLAVAVYANPLTWIFLAVAAAVFSLYLLVKNLMELFDYLVDLFKEISFTDVWDGLIDGANEFLDGLISLGSRFYDAITAGLQPAITTIRGWKDDALNLLRGACEGIGTIFDNLGPRILDALPDFNTTWTEISQGAVDGFDHAFNAISRGASRLIEWMPDWLKNKLGINGKLENFETSRTELAASLPPEDRARLTKEGLITGAHAGDALPPSVTQNNAAHTEITVDQNQTFNITSPDAQAAADAVAQRQRESSEFTATAIGNSFNTGVAPA